MKLFSRYPEIITDLDSVNFGHFTEKIGGFSILTCKDTRRKWWDRIPDKSCNLSNASWSFLDYESQLDQKLQYYLKVTNPIIISIEFINENLSYLLELWNIHKVSILQKVNLSRTANNVLSRAGKMLKLYEPLALVSPKYWVSSNIAVHWCSRILNPIILTPKKWLS